MAPNPRSSPTPSPEPAAEKLIVVDFGRPLTPLTWLAIGVSAALILLAILGAKPLAIKPSIVDLLIGCGAALVLAAFGGQAVVRGKGYIFAGVAGIAVGLVGILFWKDEHDSDKIRHLLQLQKDSYLVGRIDGLPVDRYRVGLILDNFVPSKHLAELKRFDFVMFKEEIEHSGAATLSIDDKDDETKVYSFKIPERCLTGFIGRQDKPLLWQFRENEPALIEVRTGVVIATLLPEASDKAPSCEQPPPISAESLQGTGPLLQLFISNAFAGEDTPRVTRSDIERALIDIQSSDTDVRRGARVILSNAQPEDVAFILKFVRDKLKVKSNIYRTKLGVSLALTEMLRRDKNLRMRMHFEDADFRMLLDFAGSDDRTLRTYATEFLFDLEHPAIAKLALPLALSAPSNDAFFAWVFVSQGGWINLSNDEKVELRSVVKELKRKAVNLPKTAEILDSFR